MTKLAANISMMFTEVDFLDRFEVASKAGFKGVEYLFPYDYPAEQIKEKLDQNEELANLRADTSLEKQEMANQNRLRVARMKPRGGNSASNR